MSCLPCALVFFRSSRAIDSRLRSRCAPLSSLFPPPRSPFRSRLVFSPSCFLSVRAGGGLRGPQTAASATTVRPCRPTPSESGPRQPARRRVRRPVRAARAQTAQGSVEDFRGRSRGGSGRTPRAPNSSFVNWAHAPFSKLPSGKMGPASGASFSRGLLRWRRAMNLGFETFAHLNLESTEADCAANPHLITSGSKCGKGPFSTAMNRILSLPANAKGYFPA